MAIFDVVPPEFRAGAPEQSVKELCDWARQVTETLQYQLLLLERKINSSSNNG